MQSRAELDFLRPDFGYQGLKRQTKAKVMLAGSSLSVIWCALT